MATSSTEHGTAATGSAPFVRKWETIICYEDRSYYHTSRWRLAGIKTKETAENTDSGVLWLQMTKSGDTVTASLYKDDGLASSNKVATGTADVSTTDGTGENAVELTLTASNSSGISGSFWIHKYGADANCPVQVALCTDEDLDVLWDGIEDLPGYDETYGMAEFIRLAGEDVIGKVTRLFRDELGGYGTAEAWFITDASRHYPDLRRIANPGQLQLACAYRTLEIALGRHHQRAGDTIYSVLRDKFAAECEAAMSSLTIAFKSGSGNTTTTGANALTRRLARA
ncbi:MAG: hypothetical protein HQ546_01805 [Planctomycetes bacterium]|nr:hypothetical protein [Planctomycetota bacterium]